MTTACSICCTDNRPSARYCKNCGRPLAASPQAAPGGGLAELVGLLDIRARIEELCSVASGQKARGGRPVAGSFHTILVGNSGTAKTLVCNAMAQAFAAAGLLQRSAPQVVTGDELGRMSLKDLGTTFDQARDALLVVDNVQDLLDGEGNDSGGLNRLVTKLDEHPEGPIVVLMGLPCRFREYLQSARDGRVVSRFPNRFQIEDYLPEQLVEIALGILARKQLQVDAEARGLLLQRFQHLFRESRDPKKEGTVYARNGHLARLEADAVEHAYFRRGGTDRRVEAGDIPQPVFQRRTKAEILAEIDKMVGMVDLKAHLLDVFEQAEQAERAPDGRPLMRLADHYLVTGNPGTGKTTVVRLLGEVFAELGLLATGHVVEVDRSGLVAEHVGGTGPKVNAVCDNAMGGLLFIDEAYGLANGTDGADSYGIEAVNTLLKRMEDDRGKFVVVAAGYRDKMQDLLRVNPGMKSRFTRAFHLEDFSAEQLMEVFEGLVGGAGCTIDPPARERLLGYFKDRRARAGADFANAREARTLANQAVDSAKKRHRQAGPTGEAGPLITVEDVPGASATRSLDANDALAELEGLCGLASVKASIQGLARNLRVQSLRGKFEVQGRHFLFLGNPGTGKTTVARIMGRVFHAIGFLPSAHVVEVDRSKLVAEYSGQTGPLVNRKCDEAMGGILFVDEAYGLVQGPQDGFGLEAVAALLKRMLDDRGKFVVIAAGYQREMEDFLKSNAGLASRFTETIQFEDYAPQDLVAIFVGMASRKGYALEEGVEAAVLARMEQLHAQRDETFANARAVESFLTDVEGLHACRVLPLESSGMEQEAFLAELNLLRVADIPAASAVEAWS